MEPYLDLSHARLIRRKRAHPGPCKHCTRSIALHVGHRPAGVPDTHVGSVVVVEAAVHEAKHVWRVGAGEEGLPNGGVTAARHCRGVDTDDDLTAGALGPRARIHASDDLQLAARGGHGVGPG